MIGFDERFALNLEKIKINIAVAEELAGALTDAATYLARRDQAACLTSLKSKVLADVESLLDAESAEESGFIKGRLVSTPLSFGIGGLAGALLHHKNPLKTGLDAAMSTLGKKLSFGKVLVAIGQEGLPDGVKALPLSALVRQSGLTESVVRKDIITKGYFLLTPEAFATTMDKIEQLVLDGTLSLPVLRNEFKKRIPPVNVGGFQIVQDK